MLEKLKQAIKVELNLFFNYSLSLFLACFLDVHELVEWTAVN